MSVIINELEVVVEPPQPAQPAGSAAQPPMQSQIPLRPMDLTDIFERQDRFKWRVEAH
jgi:hypothetical protein